MTPRLPSLILSTASLVPSTLASQRSPVKMPVAFDIDSLVEGNSIVACRIRIDIDNHGVARRCDAKVNPLHITLRAFDPDSPPWATGYPRRTAGPTRKTQ